MEYPLIETEEQLEEVLSAPTPEVVHDLAKLEGDLLILGVGGKIGPSLARMATRAFAEAGGGKRVIGVDYAFSGGSRQRLEESGVELIECDLLDREAVAGLPEAENVIFMAGKKFGSTGAEYETWAMNVYMPGLVAERFRGSRIVVFSSGNVYGLVPVSSGGSTENDPLHPQGDYAQSVVGRERIFEYASRKWGTRVLLLRLNYAIDLRYGVMLDVAQKVYTGQPVEVTMGYFNCLWQGDANAWTLRSLLLAASPPRVLNVTGPEVVSVRQVAVRFGELLGKEPIIEGCEADTALLSNATQAVEILGSPGVGLEQMMQWVAHWVKLGGGTLGKPTHYESRDGKF